MKPEASSRRKREYTLLDLSAMAQQLGMSVRLEVLPKELRWCEGCGKTSEEVKTLIVFRSGLAVCETCVGVCASMVAEEEKKRDEAQDATT